MDQGMMDHLNETAWATPNLMRTVVIDHRLCGPHGRKPVDRMEPFGLIRFEQGLI